MRKTEIIEKRYPLRCPEECGLDEPCVCHRQCNTWLATDFCRATASFYMAKSQSRKDRAAQRACDDIKASLAIAKGEEG